MSADATPTRGTAFGAVAEAYHRGRPELPVQTVAWLTGETPLRVLELGAGTGRLTDALVALGHDVHATDPDERMLRVLSARLPSVRVSECPAEEIEAPDSSYDVVVCSDAVEWFDLERALPEIARVLVPEGRFAATALVPDRRIPWVKRLARLLGHPDGEYAATAPYARLELSSWFGFVEQTTHPLWQVIDRASVSEVALTHADVAALGAQARAERLAEVVAFYDDYGRGMDGMQLPLVATSVRTTLLQKPAPAEQEEAEPSQEADEVDEVEEAPNALEDTMPRAGRLPPSDTTEHLLIDFR